MATPEAFIRQNIDAQFVADGWLIKNRLRIDLYAIQGLAVCEFPLETGYSDSLLFIDQKAMGVIIAKAEGK